MPRLQKLLAIVGAFSFLLAALFFLFPFFFIKPAEVEAHLVRRIEEASEGEWTYDKFQLRRFPVLSAGFQGAKLSFPPSRGLSLEVRHAAIQLKRFASLFGGVDISRIEMEGAQTVFRLPSAAPLETLEMKNIHLKLLDVKGGRPIRLELAADVAGFEKSLTAKANFVLSQFEKWDWPNFTLEGALQLRNLDLGVLARSFKPGPVREMNQGILDVSLELRKRGGDGWLHGLGRLELQHPSPEFDQTLEAELAWNPENEELSLKKASLDVPVGKLSAKGNVFFATKEVRDVRVTISTPALENIPQYAPSLKEILPLNLGFSGASDLELSLGGTLDHLTVHGTWDLTSSLLTYGRFFSKPREVPLYGSFDFLLKDAKILSGDFSVKLRQAILKGTLTDWNLQAGAGEVNTLTNKFPLAGWETFLPPIEKYRLDGETKILVHWNGPLQKKEKGRIQIHWIVEHGSLLNPQGIGLRRVRFAFDYGDVAVELKHARIEMGRNNLFPRFSIYGYPDKPMATLHVIAPQLGLPELLSDLEDFFGPWLPERAKGKIQDARQWAADFFPQGQSLKNFRVHMETRDKLWQIRSLRGEAYGGKARLVGEWDQGHVESPYKFELAIQRLNLARFLNRKGEVPNKILEGNLFLESRFFGGKLGTKDWNKGFSGDGAFSVTNGEWHTADILGVLTRIEDFSKLNRFVTGTTRFDDMRSRFAFHEGLLETRKLALLSKDISVEADGKIFLDGMLNYRLNVFLEPELAREIVPLPKTFETSRPSKKKRKLGPVPMLLSGPIEKPRLEPDPDLLPEFREDLAKKKTQKIFRTFLPEDLFFEERLSSS